MLIAAAPSGTGGILAAITDSGGGPDTQRASSSLIELRGMLSAFALTLAKHRSVRSVLIASAGS